MRETTVEYSDSERIKEIWTLFKETDKKFQETDRLLTQKFQETNRQFKETDKKFQETDRLLTQKFQETNRQFKETDKKFQETDRQFKQTAKEVEAVCKLVDALTGKWGKFVEGLIVPGMISMFESRGIDIERIFPRVKARKNGDKMEIDILGVKSLYAVLVEVKSTLGVDDVKEHLDRLKAFKRFFPEYADRKVMGAVAGIVIEGEADKFAYRKGLFVIAQTGESVAIINDDKFKPNFW